jgi:hypothetical protein
MSPALAVPPLSDATTGYAGRARRAMVRLALAGLVLIVASGCALSPWRKSESPVAPHTATADTVGQAAAQAPVDTLRFGPIGTAPIVGEETRRKPAPPKEKPAPAGAELDTLRAAEKPQLPVSVALTDKEKGELRDACLGDLAVADAIIKRLAPKATGAKAQQDLETVRGFVTQARDALSSEDVRSAATLAHKARVLAEDLASRLTP